MTLALYHQLSEWIKVCAGVFIYSFHYLVIKRLKLSFFLQSNLQNKLKLHSHHTNFAIFVPFRAFFGLEMPWKLGWISPKLYCLQKNYKNLWYAFLISLVHSCRVLVFRIARFINKKTQHLWNCMIGDESELQWIK